MRTVLWVGPFLQGSVTEGEFYGLMGFQHDWCGE
jgi:hypothetical protein